MDHVRWGGVDYVGVYVSARGYANEHQCYLAAAADSDAVDRLRELVDVERIPGTPTDGRVAYWMSAGALGAHLATCGGYVLTLDADRNPDSISI